MLEARERVGGRLLNATLAGGGVVELGGEWIGPTQERVAALARELDVETFPSYTAGQNMLDLGGRQRRYSGTIPRLGPHVLIDVAMAQWKIERLARRVDADAPWRTPGARRLDGQTFGSWVTRNVRTRAARSMLAIAGKTVWGAEPHELSLLHVLFYVRSAGGFSKLVDTEGGAQQYRLAGGSQLLALRAAEQLDPAPLLGSAVRRVEQGPDGVCVVADGVELTAQHVVVAIPPPLAARIFYDPPLPAHRDQLTQRMPEGAIAKCMAVYERPFWRDDGLTGETLSDRGPVTLTFDNSPAEGRPGVMLGFVGGSDAWGFGRLSAEDRRRSVIDCFTRLFGERAASPDEYLERDWTNEQWSGGGPTSLMAPGVWTSFGSALREPNGRIHWAGTETATVWCGYMEGAVRSGERAANEVLAELAAATTDPGRSALRTVALPDRHAGPTRSHAPSRSGR